VFGVVTIPVAESSSSSSEDEERDCDKTQDAKVAPIFLYEAGAQSIQLPEYIQQQKLERKAQPVRKTVAVNNIISLQES
jgi:hypothetical protein